MSEIKKEYIFSTYVENSLDRDKDALFVKEVVYCEGKPPIRRLTMVENYIRDFYVTKKEYQNHKDKKEFEHIDRLNRYTCTQRKLARTAFHKLNGFIPNKNVTMRDVNSSPYLYGSDVTSNDLLHYDYVKSYGDINNASKVMVMDYEWDINVKHGKILIGAVCMDEFIHIAISKEWMSDLLDEMGEEKIKEQILYHVEKDLKEYIKELNINTELDIKISLVKNQTKVVLALLKTAHELKPDFLAFWNMENDVLHMLSALKEENIDPALVFSDPSVPREYKYFDFYIDPPFKIKSNGEKMNKDPSERWHVVTTPASFYMICQMSTFRAIRSTEGKRNDYKLDSILREYLNIGKMKVKGLPKTSSDSEWHKMMSLKFKILYSVYAIGDVYFPVLLDKKTEDLSNVIRVFIGRSSLNKFKSNPRQTATDFHFELLEDNKIVGSTSSNMTTPLDKHIPSPDGWIVTVASELEYELGLNLIEEFPDVVTNISMYASDADLTGAYPSGGEVLGVSKTTCLFITCKSKDIPYIKLKEFGINLTSVRSNPLSLAKTGYGYPDLSMFYEEFIKTL